MRILIFANSQEKKSLQWITFFLSSLNVTIFFSSSLFVYVMNRARPLEIEIEIRERSKDARLAAPPMDESVETAGLLTSIFRRGNEKLSHAKVTRIFDGAAVG